MGIKYLNRLFNLKCNSKAIYKIQLQTLVGKKIAVDASIFLYRFLGEDKLIEQMYLMVSIFRNYDITPIFVFDGTAPPEKKDLLNERKENKRKAEERYLLMKDAIEKTNAMETDEKYEIEIEMEQLKKQFIYIKDADIKRVKLLLNECGISWAVARGEADEYCAHLIHTNQVYACLSEDMDMFAYGCCRILRHFSLIKHSVLMYDLPEILKQLGLNLREFRQIVVLSGTDYNKDDATSLFDVLKWFEAFKTATILSENTQTFYEWLIETGDYIKSPVQLSLTYGMFNLSDKKPGFQMSNCETNVNTLNIENGTIMRVALNAILAEEGFLF